MRGRFRWSVVAAAALVAGAARAQTAAPPYPPPAPAQQPPPAQAPAPPPAAYPGAPSTAGSQGQSSSAQPSSPGASSQQVVVNPPQPVQPAAPPSSTTVVNPPPPSTGTGSSASVSVTPPVYTPPQYADVGVTDRAAERPSPLATVAIDAGFGGIAGLLVGTGVALVEQGDHWGRDLTVGAGVGLIVGAAVGIVHATMDQRRTARADGGPPPSALARDGQGRTDRDPVITAPTVVGLAGRF